MQQQQTLLLDCGSQVSPALVTSMWRSACRYPRVNRAGEMVLYEKATSEGQAPGRALRERSEFTYKSARALGVSPL